MYFYEVAPTKIVRAATSVLTYHSDTPLPIGQLVSIPVGKHFLTGLIVRKVTKPSYDTKLIESLIEQQPLPNHLVDLALWIEKYYRTPLATVLQTMLPRGLTTKRRQAKPETINAPIRDRTKIVLNDEQTKAIEKIFNMTSGTLLLQGVTGSGKTEVYKEVARRLIASGQSVIVLVPEISLTGQIVDEFRGEFANTLITHSHMTEAQRHAAWRQLLTAAEPFVVIGPRSALFMPVSNLGAIIVDEAHESSYKQEQSPRYSALRVATMLGKFAECRVIFGSATPAVADKYAAMANGAPIALLDNRARSNVVKSQIKLVDMTKRDQFKQHQFLSDELLNSITDSLSQGKQALIFHNRRGSSSTTLCEACGWTAQCSRCFVPLVLHGDKYHMSCHVCGNQEKVPTVCPVCESANIIHKGVGTKRIEAELARLFPKATIARFDGDTHTDQTLEKRYDELYRGDIDIAIGTQVVAKGLDLPKLQVVGVIQADSGLALPDYASAERVFQLLTQVIGRVGRDERETKVVIQTYQPNHPIIKFGITQNYEEFYKYTLAERSKAGFPPFRYLLQLTNSYKTEAVAIRNAKTLAKELRAKLPSTVEILGPTPAFYEQQRGSYRWQLTLKSTRREALAEALSFVPPTHWQSELDPNSLL